MDVNLLLGWARITCPTRYSQTGRVGLMSFHLKGKRGHERGLYVWNSEFCAVSSANIRSSGRLMAPAAHVIGMCNLYRLQKVFDSLTVFDVCTPFDNRSLDHRLRPASMCSVISTCNHSTPGETITTKRWEWTLVILAILHAGKSLKKKRRDREHRCIFGKEANLGHIYSQLAVVIYCGYYFLLHFYWLDSRRRS